MNDLHCFDTATETWSEEPSNGGAPPIRSFHAMASDGQRYIFIFGGELTLYALGSCASQ